MYVERDFTISMLKYGYDLLFIGAVVRNICIQSPLRLMSIFTGWLKRFSDLQYLFEVVFDEATESLDMLLVLHNYEWN